MDFGSPSLRRASLRRFLQLSAKPSAGMGSRSPWFGAIASCCLLGATCFLSLVQPPAAPQVQTEVTHNAHFLGLSTEPAGGRWSASGVLLGAGACVAVATALGLRKRALAPAPRRVTALAAYDASKEFGACDPLLFWDPVGFCGGDCTKEDFDRRRAVEIKHGRVCMLACLGMLWPDIFGRIDGYLSPSGDLKFEDVPSGFAAISKVPWEGWSQIFLFVGVLETQLFKDQAIGGFPFGFGRISDENVRARKLLIELNNGRLAMIAFTGLVVQEGVTGQGIIDQLTSGHISPFNDGQGVFAFSGPYSLALPWAPVAEGLTNNPLDDTYVGDVGFDPLGFAKNKKLLPWYREAELAHGRACMLATLGISTQVAGGKWEPFITKYSKEEFDDLRLKEIKHCRLAMLGFLGMVIENAATGSAPTIFPANIAGQTPDFAVTVGDFYTRQTPYAPPPM